MHSRVIPEETCEPVLIHIRETHNVSQIIDVLPDACPSTFQGREEQLKACEEIYSPVLKALKLFGIYVGETSLTRISLASSVDHRRVSISLFYSCAVVAASWVPVCLMVTSLSLEGFADLTTFFLLLAELLGYLIAALSGTVCLFVLSLTRTKKSHFENFIRKLTECNAELRKLKSTSRKAIAAACFTCITTTAANITAVLLHPHLGLGSYKPWNGWHGFSVSVVNVICLIFSNGVWLLPIPLFCTTCLILERIFDDLCKRTAKNLNSLDLRALKDEHRQLCAVVDLASKVFSPLLFVVMALQIPFMCLALFVTVHHTPTQISQKVAQESLVLLCVYFLGLSGGNIAIFLIFGTRVNEKVHSIRSILEEASVPDEDQVKLLAFMFNLNSEPKGLSVGGLAVVTKSLSLTIAGIIISYFAVMISLPS